MIHLDIPAGRVELARETVAEIRTAGAAQAGRSSAARDLSLILDRALRPERTTVALRRAEVQTLTDVASALGLIEVVNALTRVSRR